MTLPTVKQLMESGAHLGHIKAKWQPKFKPYIFGIRNNIHIINLDKTLECLEKAINFIQTLTKDNQKILFVGTKKQVKEITKTAAEKCGMPFIWDRWLGGSLTNFETIRKRLKNFQDLELKFKDDPKELTKKEKRLLKEKLSKLEKSLGGIKEMTNLPDALFIIDPVSEKVAVSEAIQKQIPIVALADTNADPSKIDYLIPANDDSKKAVELILNIISDAILKAKTKEIKKLKTKAIKNQK